MNTQSSVNSNGKLSSQIAVGWLLAGIVSEASAPNSGAATSPTPPPPGGLSRPLDTREPFGKSVHPLS